MDSSNKACLLVLLVASASNVSWAADGDMLVTSRNTNSVKRYDGVTGAFLGDFVTSGSGGLLATQDAAYGPDGSFYVTGRGNTSVLRYDGQTGAFLGTFTTGRALDNPTKFSFGPDGLLYISQWSITTPTVLRYDAVTGAFVDDFTGFISQPQEHIWDVSGNLYVASFGSANVQKFDSSGNNLGPFTEAGRLTGPTNLRWGADGNMYVLDWGLGRERIFDRVTGAFLGDFAGGLTRAEGSTIGPDGFLYIADWQDNDINQFDATTGAFIKVFSDQGGLLQPNNITFTQQPIPEPSLLLSLGIGAAVVLRRRKRTARAETPA